LAKLIFFLLVAWVVYWLLRSSRRSGDAGRAEPPPPPSPEAMVACARCGLHVPRSESVESAGRHYCCPEHQRLDAGERGR
jgi:uncharacterized protein